MKSSNYYLAIMAGGVGSRFWPASRATKPKQFLDMLGTGQTLLQMTVSRFEGIIDPARILIITNADYQSLVAEQVPQIPLQNILCEPSRNNTAPCVLYTGLEIAGLDRDAVIGFVPSDHLILKEDHYRSLVEMAYGYAESTDSIVTMGITPTRPDTGYGYIKYDSSPLKEGIFPVKQFTEKPNLATAESFLASGDYLWNAGMFFMKMTTLLTAYEQLAPDIFHVLKPYLQCTSAKEKQDFIAENYPKTRKESIDFAIIEKYQPVTTIPADIGWSDLGTWASLYQESHKDDHDNAVMSKNVILENVSNTLIKNNTGKLIILRDISNVIIVEEDDVLMIYPMDKEQEIKLLGDKIQESFKDFL